MKSFQERYGPWALVTGASSGIGAEFTRQLAARGLSLVLVARRTNRLDDLARELSKRYNVQIEVITADLSKPDFMSSIRPATQSLEIGLLVNNAGFALTGPVLDHSLEAELSLLDVNCRAPLILAHEFGGKMLERRRGGIIFLASLAGFMSFPMWANYAASKAYNLFMGEAMWGELRDRGVDVLALCPGATRTEFGEVAGVESVGGFAMTVEPVVSVALRKLGKKASVIAGWRNRILYFLEKFMPRRLSLEIRLKIMRRIAKGRLKMAE
jgi:hypothetical protein